MSAVLGICTALPLVLFPGPIPHGIGAREGVVSTGSGLWLYRPSKFRSGILPSFLVDFWQLFEIPPGQRILARTESTPSAAGRLGFV
jgi:hypothetical protein